MYTLTVLLVSLVASFSFNNTATFLLNTCVGADSLEAYLVQDVFMAMHLAFAHSFISPHIAANNHHQLQHRSRSGGALQLQNGSATHNDTRCIFSGGAAYAVAGEPQLPLPDNSEVSENESPHYYYILSSASTHSSPLLPLPPPPQL